MKRECEHIICNEFGEQKFTVVYDTLDWDNCPVCRALNNLNRDLNDTGDHWIIDNLFEK